MTIQEVSLLSKYLTADKLVSIRDIQKSPTKALSWVKIVMNGKNAQWIYVDMDQWEDFLEDQEMMNSKNFKKNLEESRKSGTISREETLKMLGIDL